MIIFDPDCRNTWADFEDFVYDTQIWQQIECKFELGQNSGEKFLFQLECAEHALNDGLARSLRQRGKEILFTSYTHVAGYHGCRPSNRASYQLQGFRLSNTEELLSEARSLFKGIEGFDNAVQEIGEPYLKHNEGKVGLLFSSLRAKDEHISYAKGSELIRSIAFRLGEVAQARYANIGKPTLIKCAIPVEWLDKDRTFSVSGGYCNWILNQLIQMRKKPTETFIGCEGGFMLIRAVPPELILEFIDVSNFIDNQS